MILFRCTLKKWANDLSGKGAFMYGGRWNSEGVYIMYTAENNVLAALEVALRIPLEYISKDYVMVALEIKGHHPTTEPKLPKNWRQHPDVTKSIGDTFVKNGKHLLMKVPSALISDSYNYLINPLHYDIKTVEILEPKSILFDERLMELIRLKK